MFRLTDMRPLFSTTVETYHRLRVSTEPSRSSLPDSARAHARCVSGISPRVVNFSDCHLHLKSIARPSDGIRYESGMPTRGTKPHRPPGGFSVRMRALACVKAREKSPVGGVHRFRCEIIGVVVLNRGRISVTGLVRLRCHIQTRHLLVESNNGA